MEPADTPHDESEGEYKSGAKCKFHALCSLYSNNILPKTLEEDMCGLGQNIDDTYEPEIPVLHSFTPPKGYVHGPGGICDGFMYHKEISLISRVVKNVIDLKNALDNHNYW